MIIDQRLKALDPDQAKAIVSSINQNTLLLAGPGSGKTRTLQTRYLYLVEKEAVNPINIMAVTFTNKSAGELKERILNDLPNLNLNKAYIGTFHGLCVRILHTILPAVTGLDIQFSIIDPSDCVQLVKEAFNDLVIEGNHKDMVEFYDAISTMKSDMISPKAADTLASTDRLKDQARVYRKYQEYLTTRHLLDFDEIILSIIKYLIKYPAFKTAIQDKFKYIMVDESQDTSKMQIKLLQLMLGPNSNIFLVGDMDQGIYSWRGASPATFAQLDKMFPNLQILELGSNYRSTQSIVQAAATVIKNNIVRYPKNMKTTNGVGVPIEIYATKDRLKEANTVAGLIKQLAARNSYKYSEIAILYRTNDISRNFEDALMSFHIPYEIVGSVSFYDRKEIKDLMCVLKSFHDIEDSLSIRRTLKMLDGVADGTIQKLISNPNGIEYAILHTKGKVGTTLKDWLASIHVGRDHVIQNNLNLRDTLNYIYKTYYSSILQTYDKYKERVANIDSFLGMAAEYEVNYGDNTLNGFINFLLLYSAQDDLTKNDTVKLITGHGAKGLEFKAVFIVAAVEGIIPHKMCVTPMEIEEERRLFFVMMTRAQERLFITYSGSYCSFGGIVSSKKSPFIDEIPVTMKTFRLI